RGPVRQLRGVVRGRRHRYGRAPHARAGGRSPEERQAADLMGAYNPCVSAKRQGESGMTVEVGQPAPEFTLNGTDGQAHSLSQYRGKNVVLFFFPKAFTGTCETQISTHAKEIDRFKGLNAVVLGVSTDQTPSQQAFAKQCDPKNDVVLLSDF